MFNCVQQTGPQIPKFLMERWSKFDTEGVRLAKIRIYKPQSGAPRIVVFVPPEDGIGGDEDGDMYELDMVKQKVENQIAVAERAKAPSRMGRARTTIMTGQIKHECNLRPCMTERYERRLMERGAAANERSMRVRVDGWGSWLGSVVGRCSAVALRLRLVSPTLW
jgi:transcription initiation factor TFIIF subunit beta